MIVKALAVSGLALVGQFGFYWYKHRGDGGGNDGGMGVKPCFLLLVLLWA